MFGWRKKYLEETKCVTMFTHVMKNEEEKHQWTRKVINALGSYAPFGYYGVHAAITFTFAPLGYICFKRYIMLYLW